MRRIAGIIVFVIGLLVFISHVAGLVPGVKWLGIFCLFLGGVMFGLSFIPQPAPGADAPPPLSAADRITKVFYEPDPVFKNLRHYPRWLAGFLVLVLFSLTYQLAVIQRIGPERLAEDRANRIIEGGYLQNAPISPDDFKQAQIAQAISTATLTKISLPIWTAGGTLIFLFILAGLYLLGVIAFGGRMNFWQAVSVAVYSSIPPTIILTVLNLILLYTQSVDDMVPMRAQQQGLARADLGLLFSPSAHPFLYTLAGSIGLFTIYRLWLTANGLKNTATKIKNGSAWAIVLLLWVLGLLLSLVAVMLAPTFVA
ncbi:MAG TPA: YIP1 family protein [Pyrinomonadaceae bacterium]|nr:YIP1 family protein [Pyrinomonadaceae bacterium]